VADASEQPRVSVVASRLGIPRNTTYELINTLVEQGYLELDGRGCVKLGIRLYELGGAYARSIDLIRESQQLAREVADRTGETCRVARLEGREVVYLVKEEGTQVLRMTSIVGLRLPAHGTGVGKVLMAYTPRPKLLSVLDGVRLEKLTPRTITNLSRLLRELDRIVVRGYGIDHEESTPYIRCVAAPIRDEKGDVVLAMSISVPALRWSAPRERELIAVVTEAAARLSKHLSTVARKDLAV